jgi:hypothetical protein
MDMKQTLLTITIGLTFIITSCSNRVFPTLKKSTLYNSYLVKHRKYNMKQIFNYPSDVNFWSVQDSTTYQMVDTLKYRVKYSELSK